MGNYYATWKNILGKANYVSRALVLLVLLSWIVKYFMPIFLSNGIEFVFVEVFWGMDNLK